MSKPDNKPLNESSEKKAASSFLQMSTRNLPGIGEKYFEALSKSKISNINDIIFAFPFRYEVLGSSDSGEKGVLSGVYENHAIIGTRQGKKMFKAVFRSDNGFVAGVWLHFTADYPSSMLKKGETYHLYGAVARHDGMYSIFHPEFINGSDIGSVRSVYSSPATISQAVYRKALKSALDKGLELIDERLPVPILDHYNYPDIKDAVLTIHSPGTKENANAITERRHLAYTRFVYEEFFYFQIAMQLRKRQFQVEQGIKFKVDKEFLLTLKDIMPFKLTSAQRRTFVEVLNDMASDKQMNRLVQGDVGSGKTVIAFLTGAVAVNNGYQVILIAPTEVLAEQHFHNMQAFFKNKGYSICLMTGSVSKKDKLETKELIRNGAIDFVVGTHAILEDDAGFAKLGLVIVDEQHRFGVHQRKILLNKGLSPDILLMTATPIPRTLAMTLYGDLDVSIIDEMPAGRIPCITKSFTSSKLKEALEFAESVMENDSRAYFIYPLIDESDKVELKAATQSFDYIKRFFKNKNVGLLHGKLKSDEKRQLLESFKNGSIDILVSTTVVEVGVDVKEATVIFIENAERFGLSQLHQLRGRVGRNDKQSYCILVTSPDLTENGRERIKAMMKYTDGFKLAEVDLSLRGQGDFFGTRQSGLPDFKFADISKDINILQDAKRDAEDTLSSDRELKSEDNKLILDNLKRIYSDESTYFGVG